MANPEHLEILKQGVPTWNRWRSDQSNLPFDLSGADLHSEQLSGANFRGWYEPNVPGMSPNKAALFGANLSGADLNSADLTCVNIQNANLTGARLEGTNCSGADFTGSNLSHVHLGLASFGKGVLHYNNAVVGMSVSILCNVNLSWASIDFCAFNGADLAGADLSEGIIGYTDFSRVSFRSVKGLRSVKHRGPSNFDLSVLLSPASEDFELFLRGAGVPEPFLTNRFSLAAAIAPIRFASCFMSHSSSDVEISEKLYSDLRAKNLQCYLDKHDMRGGDWLHSQIDRAINLHDRVLLLVSEASMASKWVETEMRKAFAKEKRENRRVIFPLALVPLEYVRAWECFDNDTGEDLARKVREYFIPDFSNWKDHDSYQRAFQRLLRDLKADGGTGGSGR